MMFSGALGLVLGICHNYSLDVIRKSSVGFVVSSLRACLSNTVLQIQVYTLNQMLRFPSLLRFLLRSEEK